MKKILIVGNYSGLYGSEVMLRYLSKALSGAYSVESIVNPSSKVPSGFLVEISGRARSFNVLSRKNIGLSMASFIFWLKYLRDSRPDLLIINISLIPEVVLAARLTGTKCLVMVRESLVDSELLFKFYRPFLELIPTALVCNSKYTAGMFRKNVYVLPDCSPRPNNGISAYSPIESDGRIVIGFVGRISPRKGVHLIPQALQLCGLNKAFHFILVGDAKQGDVEYRDTVARHFETLGASYEFVGFQEDPVAHIRRCSLTIAPSIQPETFGLVVLESLQEGVPVVAAATGAYVELVEDQLNGFLFKPGDAVDLSRVLAKLLTLSPSEVQRMKIAAQEKARFFTFERYTTTARGIVDDVISRIS